MFLRVQVLSQFHGVVKKKQVLQTFYVAYIVSKTFTGHKNYDLYFSIYTKSGIGV